MSGMRSLNKQEYESISGVLKTSRDRLLFVLGYYTGFRITELLSLTIGQVYKKTSIRVMRQNMKGKVESREVQLHSSCIVAIADYLNTIELTNFEDLPLFSSLKGVAISRMQAHRIIKNAANALGLQGSIATHSMRKSLCRNVYEKSGHDLVLTQKAMGHKSILSTIKYLDIKQEEANEVIKSL